MRLTLKLLLSTLAIVTIIAIAHQSNNAVQSRHQIDRESNRLDELNKPNLERFRKHDQALKNVDPGFQQTLSEHVDKE